MTHYLISFPSGEMDIPDGEFPTVVEESHAVIREAKEAGVYVFGGGINEEVPPALVRADGTVAEGTYPQTRRLEGGYTVLARESRAEAERWAAKIAAACRCAQELREFMDDPES
jgi:hypothetical protein